MEYSPLEVTEIDKSYHGRKVLHGVSLQLSRGEIFGLIGLNGAGKTTLIKTVLDLINAEKGHATIFGISSKRLDSRRKLSYLPEKFEPSRYLKGYEYLELSLSYYGKKLDRALAKAKAKAVDLDPDVLGNRLSTYSKGMGQKLGLLGAFLIEAPLLILDEPMSGLDPRARIQLKKTMREYTAQGNTIFFSSHILADIDEICERVGVIHEGGLYFTGTPLEFRERYGDNNLEKAYLNLINATAEVAKTA